MPAKPSSADAVSAAASRLWTTTGRSSSSASASCPSNSRRCSVGRGVELHVVEAGLADRDGLRMREELAQLVEPPGFRGRGLVRVDAERRENAVVLAREREGGAAGVDPGADRDDPRDARPPRHARSLLPARRTRRGARASRSRRAATVRVVLHALQLLGDHGVGIQLREQRLRLSKRLTRPGARSAPMLPPTSRSRR